MEIPFLKLHGCRNSFVIVRRADVPTYDLWSAVEREELARRICSAGSGLGADGFFLVSLAADGIEVEMRNPDGGLMGMCGNGVRCVVRAAYKWGWKELPHPLLVRIDGHQVICETHDEGRSVRVAMGPARLEPTEVPFALDRPLQGQEVVLAGRRRTAWAVSMGNPHCVLDDEGEELREVGPLIEHDPLFPKRTNVEFISVISRSSLAVRVWERGAGVTQACGTGACAAAVISIERGLCESPVVVRMPGGDLLVEWNQCNNEVFLSGPSEDIAAGVVLVDFPRAD